MKQVFLSGGHALVENVQIPPLSKGMVLVRTYYSFISSGTEAATLALSGRSVAKRVCNDFRATSNKIFQALREHGIYGTYSLVRGAIGRLLEVGYSCSGRVVASAPDTGLAPGDCVACAGAGFAMHGDFVSVPKNLLVKLSGKKKLREASIVAIGAVALQGFRRSGLVVGEDVCVVGLGLVGLMTVQFARRSGCRVFGVDLDKKRCALGKKLGCEKVFQVPDLGLADGIRFATSQRGVDATIITAASKSGEVVELAMELTRCRGRVVVVGDVRFDFGRENFYTKELDLRMSCSYGPGRYDQRYERRGLDYPYEFVRWTENRNMELVVRMIESGELDVDSLISREFSVVDASAAYSFLNKEKPLGVVFSYAGNARHKEDVALRTTVPCAKTKYPKNGLVNIAFIGAGGFAKTMLIPVLKKFSGVKISWLTTSRAPSALNVAKQFGIANFGNDYHQALNDPNVNAVVIATPHYLHVRQAIDAIKAGKAVFVEKPSAVTPEQFKELHCFLKQNPNAIYCVDFNRSYAPLIKPLMDALEGRSTPVCITYRMNVNAVPDGHWLHQAENGGRIIGEACHIFELFISLIRSDPVRLSVTTSPVSLFHGVSNCENVNVGVSFNDGSSANLIYTVLGSDDLPKEHMEVFWDGKSAVLDDFKKLDGYGVDFDYTSSWRMVQDKGHKSILRKFCDVVSSENNQFDENHIDRIMWATRLSLQANCLARLGGGFMCFSDACDTVMPALVLQAESKTLQNL